MNLILQLSPDTEALLKQQATLTGRTVEALALEALQEKLADRSEPATALTHGARMAAFRAWFTAHPTSSTRNLDDSRASLYSSRGA